MMNLYFTPPVRRGLSTLGSLSLILMLLSLTVQPAFAGSLPPTLGQLGMINKSASRLVLVLNETLTYTIHLEVGWNATLQAAVTDPLPERLDYVPGTADHGGIYDDATRTLSWIGIDVAHGTPVDLKFDVKMTGAVTQPTPTANTASISWNGFVLQRQAWVTLLPDLTSGGGLMGSFKAADPRLLGAGDRVKYTVRLINSGPGPATATVTDAVPAPLTYVDGSVDGGGVYDPATHTVTWKDVLVPPFSPLLPVEPPTLTFFAKAPDVMIDTIRPVVVTNTAVITSGSLSFQRSVDILLVNHTTSPLEGSFKTASQLEVVPDQQFTYTIELHNSGTVPVPAVVHDPLPMPMTYVDGSANAGGVYDSTSRTLTWDNLTVPEGSSLVLTFDVIANGPNPSATPGPVQITNTAQITSGRITLSRSVRVMLKPGPGGDTQSPKVQSVTIGSQDVLTDAQVTLHIAATDNVAVTDMYIKEWVLATTPYPHWQEMQSSGWIPFQANAPWTLTDQSGTHYVGVWVADAAKNRSHLTRTAIDFASLLLPGAIVAQGEMVPYLVYYPADVDVTATLHTLSGSAHLFAWYPGNMFNPDQTSPTPTSDTQTLTFTTPSAGMYLFLVLGRQDATYDLAITPGGGQPAINATLPLGSSAGILAAPGMSTLSAPGTSILAAPDAGALDGMTTNPILPQSGLDPLSSANEPSGPFYWIYLPDVTHS